MTLNLLIPSDSFLYPGLEICTFYPELKLSHGLFVQNNMVTSSLMGRLEVSENQLSVCPIAKGFMRPSMKLGSIVFMKVESIRDDGASGVILGCGDNGVRGNIRKEHMRSFDIDGVKVWEMVGVGDIVRAKVRSLAESKRVGLGIEDDGLGVIVARSRNGRRMEAVDRDRMRSPVTKMEFARKIAINIVPNQN